MTETTARAALFELQSSPSPSYTWAVAQKPVSVRIPFPVIDRLEQEAVESFRSLSSKGSEIGGLLFGKVSPGEPREVSIEDYELIACDYTRGPLYRLADVDTGRFDRAILQRVTSGSLGVIGFFRSHTRKGLALDAEDLTFFDSRFREAYQIALLIRPFATKASTAGIFIREGGTVNGDTSYLEFPFRSSLLSPDKPQESFESKPSASGLGGALPAPAVPRTAVRGQIVPIASRREASASMPDQAVETESAKPNVETAEVAAVDVAPAIQPPAVEAPTQPAPPAPEKAAPPKAEERAVLPKVEEKAPLPKVEEKPTRPRTEEKSAKPSVEAKAVPPKADEKTARPKTEEKGAKPAVDAKSAPAKAAPPRKAPELAVPTSAAVAAPVSSPADPAVPARGRGKMLWIGLGAAIPIILLIALFVYPPLLHRNRPPAAAQDNSQLSLRVERTAGEILLTWNRDSDAIRSAAHAVLSISDGDQHENVEMDLAQLRNGSISYSPASGDVVFRMEVIGKNQEKTASESVRALRTRPSPLATPESANQTTALPPSSAAAAAAAAGKPPVTNAPNTPNTSPNANPGNSAPAQTAANTPPPAQQDTPVKNPDRPLKPFQAPSLSQRLHPANAADLPDAPTVARVQGSATPAVTGFNMNSVSAPVAPAAPRTTPSNPPPAEKKAAAAASGGQIQQAVLIAKKDPEYPKLARDTGAEGVVQLRATIGVDGRVKSVTVVKGPQMLQKAASDAVMQWKYRPTILNGVPVEAETEVFVNFLGNEH